MAKVLVTDDERAICDAFSQFLTHDGHQALIASNGDEAIDVINAEHPDAVFLDVNMPGMDGLETLKKINAIDPHVPVILMTAYGTMQTAITAMREGAFDYLGKPVELAQLRKILNKALHQPAAEIAHKPPPLQTHQKEKQLIGQSPVMQEIFKLMGLLTTNDLSVLVMGESGVGKELVAQGIHQNSPKSKNPFIAVNCAAIPESLIESELFGHEKGAFTGANERRTGRFEAANNGTLFLDEITELPLHLQSKLLRVLQERTIDRVGSVQPIPVNARLITATNKDLSEEVNAGRFREDLYHRLKLATLEIPPLRKRKDDIEALAYHFLALANNEMGKNLEKIEDTVIRKLYDYDWPGNVRELENTIKRSMLTTRGNTFTIHDLDLAEPTVTAATESNPLHELQNTLESVFNSRYEQYLTQKEPSELFNEVTSFVEQELIELALKVSDSNQVAASKLLGLHRSTLRKKMRNQE